MRIHDVKILFYTITEIRDTEEETLGVTAETLGVTEETLGLTEETLGVTEETLGVTEDTPTGVFEITEPEEEEALPPEILEILGETPSTEKKYGKKVKEELAVHWAHTATKGLTKEQRNEIIKLHLVPENAKVIDAPLLNPELKAAITEILHKKDKAIEQKQKQIASSIACISEALSCALKSKDLILIKSLTDAGKLMCDLQHTESMLRRGYICSFIKKDIKEQLYHTQINEYLFGDKLAETLKAAKAINRSGAELKNQRKNLNWKPPLPSPSRQVGVNTRRLPAATATTASAPYPARQPLRRPPPPAHLPPAYLPPAHPPQRAYTQRSRPHPQPRK